MKYAVEFCCVVKKNVVSSFRVGSQKAQWELCLVVLRLFGDPTVKRAHELVPVV